jgi:hypothetical protein
MGIFGGESSGGNFQKGIFRGEFSEGNVRRGIFNEGQS